MGTTNCPNKNPNAPDLRFKGKPYVTDSRTSSIIRKENGKVDVIPTNDPRFDGRMVYTIDEVTDHMKELQDISWRCEKWRPATPSVIRFGEHSIQLHVEEETGDELVQ